MRELGLVFIAGFVLCGCSFTLELDQLSEGEPACGAPCQTKLLPGSVGSGIVVPWNLAPRREIVGGFVQGNNLIVGVRVHGSANEGALLAITLDSGHRELIAGVLKDADGVLHTQGADLKDVRSVAPMTDGSWSAHLWSGFEFTGRVVSIDPTTGSTKSSFPVGGNCPGSQAASFVPDIMDSVLNNSGEAFMSMDGINANPDGVVHVTQDLCDPTGLNSEGPFALETLGNDIWHVDVVTAALGKLRDGSPPAESVAAANPGGRVKAMTVSETQIYLYRAPASLEIINRTALSRRSVALKLPSGPPETAPNLFLKPDGALLMETDGQIFAVDTSEGACTLISY